MLKIKTNCKIIIKKISFYYKKKLFKIYNIIILKYYI